MLESMSQASQQAAAATALEPEDVIIMKDIDFLLFGSFLFLGVVFCLGLFVNVPAAVIYCRSRQIRGFTDKFILFVLIVDLLSLFILIPISFLFVLEYSASIDGSTNTGLAGDNQQETRPFFLDDDSEDQKIVNINTKSGVGGSAGASGSSDDDGDFSSYCVQQWVLIIHKLIFIMAANLSILGALKIAVERYLAVVAPLHYHKILKSSVIFFVSLFSFVLSLACAVIVALDPVDFSGPLLIGSRCSPNYFGQPSSWSSVTLSKDKQSSSISLRFDSEDDEDLPTEGLVMGHENSLSEVTVPFKSLHPDDSNTLHPSGAGVGFLWWWPVLKLVHASVFFLVPVTVMIFMYLRIRTEARKQNHRMTYRNKSTFILPPTSQAAVTAEVATDVKKQVGFTVDSLHQVFGKFKLVQRIRQKARMDRAARVAVLTIGLSVLCFGPLFFVQIISAIATLTKPYLSNNLQHWTSWTIFPKSHHGQGVQFAKFLLPTLLACLHPLLSPLVYVYRYKRVRSELKTLLKKVISSCCCCCCNNDSHTSSSSSTSAADCQEVIRQFNNLAEQQQQKLPQMAWQPKESQITAVTTEGGSGDTSSNSENTAIAITIDMKPVNSDNSSGGRCYQHSKTCGCNEDDEIDDSEDDEEDIDDLVGRQVYSATTIEAEFSDMDTQGEHDHHHHRGISVVAHGSGSNHNSASGGGGLLHIVSSWMSSYSRRWNQHRESVTSTASFITLLSNRSRSIPSSTADI